MDRSLLLLLLALALASPAASGQNITCSWARPARQWRAANADFAIPPASAWGAGAVRPSATAAAEVFVLGGASGDGSRYQDDLWAFSVDASAPLWPVRAQATSEYCWQDGWCAAGILGPPQRQRDGAELACGDASSNWTPLEAGSAVIELTAAFSAALPRALTATVYEAFNAPFVTKIEILSCTHSNSSMVWTTVWDGTDTTPCPGVLSAAVPDDAGDAVGVRVSTSHSSWEEINTIGLAGLQYRQLQSRNASGTASGTPPEGTLGPAAYYDAVHDRLVVFGGRRSTYRDTLSVYDHATAHWSTRTPAGDAAWPLARYGHALVGGLHAPGDNASCDALLFGGRTSLADSLAGANDTWLLRSANLTWDPLRWSGTQQQEQQGPSPRFAAAMTSINASTVVVFGGRFEEGTQISTLGDLWMGHADWGALSMAWGAPDDGAAARPHNRSHSVLVHWASHDCLLLIGGRWQHGSSTAGFSLTLFNDVWSFGLSTGEWTLVNNGTGPTAPPPWAEMSAAMVSTPLLGAPSQTERVLLFGGLSSASVFGLTNTPLALVVEYWPHTNTWSQWGQQPPQRSHHVAVVFESRYLVVVGGRGAASLFAMNDLWVWDRVTQAWTRTVIAGESPSPRFGASCILTAGDRALVFGGATSLALSSFSDELWQLRRLSTLSFAWERVTTTGAGIAARGFHTASLLGGTKMVVFAGRSDTTVFGDLGELDLFTMAWRYVVPSTASMAPAARYSHGALAQSRGDLVIMGGSTSLTDDRGDLADVVVFHFDNNTWTGMASLRKGGGAGMRMISIPPDGCPGYVGGRQVPGGRYGGDALVVDGSLYGWSGAAWVRLAYLSPGRSGHSVSLLGADVVVFGGASSEGWRNDVAVFSLGEPCSSSTSSTSTIAGMADTADGGGVCVPCSPGTGYDAATHTCVPCAVGYYSSDFGPACTLCSTGFYGVWEGGTSILSACRPCPWGTKGVAGQATCAPCDADTEFCGLATARPLSLDLSHTDLPLATNPAAMTDVGLERANEGIQVVIIVSAALLGTVVFLFVAMRLSSKWAWQTAMIPMDVFFTDRHTTPLNEPIRKRRTVIGGCLSVVFSISVIILCAAVIVPWALDNETETRTLVPGRLHGTSIATFNMSASVVFHGVDGTLQGIEFAPSGLTSAGTTTTSTQPAAGEVHIAWVCTDCGLSNPHVALTWTLRGTHARAQAIAWTMETSSGLPGQVSRASGRLVPESGTLFRGEAPSTAVLRTIPIAYTNLVNSTAGTGLQLISLSQSAGTTVNATSMVWSRGLVAMRLELAETETTLSIKLVSKQTLAQVTAAALGAFSGTLGAFTFLLKWIEKGKSKWKSSKSTRGDGGDITMGHVGHAQYIMSGTLWRYVSVMGVRVWRKFDVSVDRGPPIRLLFGDDDDLAVPLAVVDAVEARAELPSAPAKYASYGVAIRIDRGLNEEPLVVLLAAMDADTQQSWVDGIRVWVEHARATQVSMVT